MDIKQLHAYKHKNLFWFWVFFLPRLWSVFALHDIDTCAEVQAVQVGGAVRAGSARDRVQVLHI